MQTKNKKNYLIIYFLIFFVFSISLSAEEFNITAKEVLIDKENEILIGKGSVKAIDTQGKVINADKITYEKSKEFLLAEGEVKINNIKLNNLSIESASAALTASNDDNTKDGSPSKGNIE